MPGKAELARIHILKKEAELCDEDYRLLLDGAAGVNSATEIKTPDQYYKVITALQNLLKAQGKPLTVKPIKKPMWQVAEDRAQKVLGQFWKNRLEGYLKRFGGTDLQNCNHWQIRQVMGFLSSVERREKNNGRR